MLYIAVTLSSLVLQQHELTSGLLLCSCALLAILRWEREVYFNGSKLKK